MSEMEFITVKSQDPSQITLNSIFVQQFVQANNKWNIKA